jgi:uroporphyrin-3 C-methyltransferase
MSDSPASTPQAHVDAPRAPADAAPSAGSRPGAGASSNRVSGIALFVALVAIAVAAWQWHDERTRSEAVRQELAKRLADADVQAKEGRLIAEQARAATIDAQVKLGVLENRLAESQSQQIALEALYQELSRNRDEWAYAEIDQSLQVANQQLQLAGNVKAALIALQNVDTRLQRMERPQFRALRKAINRDIERLKALPHVDIIGISLRLDGLAASVDALPLTTEVRPQPQALGAEADTERGPWLRFWHEVWGDAKQLIRVQRVDKPDPPLLAPAQSYFLRENLRLRLGGARLALLARDETNYKADLRAASEWTERYFDGRNHQVAHAVSTLRALHAAKISIEVPDISGTLDALRLLRIANERSGR